MLHILQVSNYSFCNLCNASQTARKSDAGDHHVPVHCLRNRCIFNNAVCTVNVCSSLECTFAVAAVLVNMRCRQSTITSVIAYLIHK